MASRIPVGIAGTGSYVPERVVPNSYFEKLVDTSDEWIVQRTGIEERRFAADDQATSDLSLEAAKAEIRRCSGTQFDPRVVDVFFSLPDSLWEELRRNVGEPLRLAEVET